MPWTVRLTMFLLVAAQLVLLNKIAYQLCGPMAATITMMAMCALSPFAFEWELRARGYQAMLVLVLLVVFLNFSLQSSSRAQSLRKNTRVFMLGFIIGVAVWTNELALLLLFPLVLTCRSTLFSSKCETALAGAGIAAGFSPRFIYNFQCDFEGFKYLAGLFLVSLEANSKQSAGKVYCNAHFLKRTLQASVQ